MINSLNMVSELSSAKRFPTEVLAGESLLDVPAEDVLVPHPRSDVHVCVLWVVLGDD